MIVVIRNLSVFRTALLYAVFILRQGLLGASFSNSSGKGGSLF